MKQKQASRKYFWSILVIVLSVGFITLLASIWTLYHSALESERQGLVELVESNVRLIDAVANFDADYSHEDHSGGAIGATLSQIQDFFLAKPGFGETGEFVIGQKNSNGFIILLSTRERSPDKDLYFPLDHHSKIAEPMQKALLGEAGTVIGMDYRAKKVLAAYMPSTQLEIGFVAKIDLDEFQQPFIKVSLLAAGIALSIIVLGSILISQIEVSESHAIGRNEPFGLKSKVKPKEWFIYRTLLMAIVTFVVSSVSVWLLYNASFETSEKRLLDIVEAQAAFIDVIAKFDVEHNTLDYPGGPKAATLQQLRDMASLTPGFGQTGEFVIGQYKDHSIEFLTTSRHLGKVVPPVHMVKDEARAIQRALSGQTGSLIGLDYRAELTLAAYKPLPRLSAGLVAKVDLKEIRAPFIKAVLVTSSIASIAILCGAILLWRLSILIQPPSEDTQHQLAASDSASLKSEKITPSLIFFTVGLGLSFFVFDLSLPLGAAGGVLYILFVLVGKLYPKRCHTLWLAVIATVLTVLGYFYSPQGGEEWVVIMNRVLAIFAIWVTALTVNLGLAHKKSLKLQAEELRKLSLAIENSPASVIITDPEGIAQYVNLKFTRLTGFERKEVIGYKFNHTRSEDTPIAQYRELWQTLRNGDEWQGVFHNKKKSGERYWEQASIHPLLSSTGEILNFVSLQEDITERKEAEEKLKYLACHDILTGLPTRNLCMDRLESAMAIARRNQSKLAVLFVDLDGFKIINDTFGHDMGDQILKAVGERLSLCIRETDTVARFGGDEFIMILNDLLTQENASTVAEKVIGAVSKPYYQENVVITLGASIGIALYPDHSENTEELIQKADQAMYRIKSKGKNNYAFIHS